MEIIIIITIIIIMIIIIIIITIIIIQFYREKSKVPSLKHHFYSGNSVSSSE